MTKTELFDLNELQLIKYIRNSLPKAIEYLDCEYELIVEVTPFLIGTVMFDKELKIDYIPFNVEKSVFLDKPIYSKRYAFPLTDELLEPDEIHFLCNLKTMFLKDIFLDNVRIIKEEEYVKIKTK